MTERQVQFWTAWTLGSRLQILLTAWRYVYISLFCCPI